MSKNTHRQPNSSFTNAKINNFNFYYLSNRKHGSPNCGPHNEDTSFDFLAHFVLIRKTIGKEPPTCTFSKRIKDVSNTIPHYSSNTMNTHCLKITQNVSFQFLVLFANFCLIKIDLSGNTV